MSASVDICTVDGWPSSSDSDVLREGIVADDEEPLFCDGEGERAIFSPRARLLRSPLTLLPSLRSMVLLRSSASSSKDRLKELLSVGIETLILGHLSPIVRPGVDDGGDDDERTNGRFVAGCAVLLLPYYQ